MTDNKLPEFSQTTFVLDIETGPGYLRLCARPDGSGSITVNDNYADLDILGMQSVTAFFRAPWNAIDIATEYRQRRKMR